MSHRRTDSLYGRRNVDVDSSLNSNNMFLVPSTRQHERMQTMARPVSNVFEAKHQNVAANESQQRRKVVLLNSDVPSRQNQPKPLSPVATPGTEHSEAYLRRYGFLNSVREVQSREKKQPKVQLKKKTHRRESQQASLYDDDSSSDTATEIDSLYDNQNFSEDQSVTMPDSDCEESSNSQNSIQTLHDSLHRMTTRYVHRVQSKVEEALSKLKTQANRLPEKPKEEKKPDGGAAGDVSSWDKANDTYKRMSSMKRDCYKKIEANLAMLKNLDSITNELHHNQMNVSFAK